jgi:hypothetical protein
MPPTWAQADVLSIQMDGAGAVWNTGHVAAVLPRPGGVSAVVAADTGGVYSVTSSGACLCVGDWDAPDTTCMEQGPDGPDHIFVGGGTGLNLCPPEVVVTSGLQLHAFGVGQDHSLWHYTKSSGAWSDPVSLGKDIVGPPAVCSWGGGRIDVFVVGTDGALLHKAWNGAAWLPSPSGYESLGGGIVGQPCAVAWGSNRLDVFVIGTDGALHHKWWDGVAWGPSISGFEGMGGNLIECPVAVSTAPNHLDVFCLRSVDRMLLHKQYDGAAWLPSLTDFDTLGTVENIPAVTSWGGGAIQLCAVLSDGSMGYKSWDGTQWLPSATDWTPLGSAGKPFISAPTIASWGLNRIDLACVDSDGVLQHKWLVGTTWGTDWENMGVWVAGRPVLVSGAANRLDLVVNGGDGLFWVKSYDGFGWQPSVQGWTPLTRPLIGALHETDVTQLLPLLSWREIAVPMVAGRVQAIAIMTAQRQIIVGCDNGLWSSPIPPSSALGVGYVWTRITGVPDCTYAGLAVTSIETFVAAAFGSNPDSGAYGMFRGIWAGIGWAMQRSSVAAVDPRLMGRTSLASCPNALNSVYAVGCDVITDHAYTETPEAVCWGPNRIDLFHRAWAGDCVHLFWDGSSWNWNSLGGIFLSQPRAVAWGANRLDVFGVGTDRALYHRAWDGLTLSAGWDRLGGMIVVGEPAVCSWGANRFDVFVTGEDGGLYYKWWGGSGWGPALTGYQALGGSLWGSPVAVAPAFNVIDVYGCGTDGALYRKRWDVTHWAAWERLGDEQAFSPAAVAGGGVVHVFARGSGGNVLHKQWDGAAWHPSPTTYEDLGGSTWDAPTAVMEGSTVDVFVRWTDNQIYSRTWNGTSWGDWVAHGGNSLGTPAVALESGPKAVSWGGGRRDVFVITQDPTPRSNFRVFWDLWSSGGGFNWRLFGGDLRTAVAPFSLYTFLRSSDAGASFQATGMYRSDDLYHQDLHLTGGNQGYYNNCLAVKPTDARTVAVGWRNATFLTQDGGDTFRALTDGGAQHLHSDYHALRFDPTGSYLFVGSDGGLASTPDLGSTWNSTWNRQMFTLQTYGGPCFDASYQVDGLVVAGLQDNGNISCRIGHNEPWRQFLQSDGGITLCLRRTGQILYTNNSDPKLSVFKYGGAGAKVPLTVPKPSGSPDADGLAVMPDIVNSPSYRNGAGERMLAVGFTGNDLYGAFAHDDGSDIHWEYLGSITAPGANITCISSGDGQTIFAGFSDGNIAAFQTASQSSTFQTVHPGRDGRGSVQRIYVHSTTHVFAICNRGPNGVVLRFLGSSWERLERNLPVEVFTGLTADWTITPQPMFVSTDSRVYTSTDDGASWQIMATGLPVRAHLNNLAFVSESTGNRYVYASTWGRSMWRCT